MKTAALFLLASTLCIAQGLDPAAILHPQGDGWPTYNGDYSGRRFSTLAQINQSTIKNLNLAWIYRANAGETPRSIIGGEAPAPQVSGAGGPVAGPAAGPGGFGTHIKATPLMVNGILYFTAPDNTWAVDARSGQELWHYFWKTKGATHIGNRGVGMWRNYLFMETPDDYLVSLDAKTGKERWHKQIADLAEGYFSTPAPIVIGNHVLVGTGNDLDAPGFIQSRDPETGEALDRTALRNEAAVIFMAGHETTANSLAWTWFLLSQAPQAEARVHAELAQVLGGRLPTLEDLPDLVFTRAVFEETIRLYPPVPLLGRQAMRDEAIRKRSIPAGSLVAVVPWLLHRHRRLWEQPDHFIPERFLPENAAARQRYSYVPFSVGPRVCAGQAFGLTEAILCLATLAQRSRLRLVPGTVVEPIGRLSLRPGERLPMRVEPRG